MSVMQFLINAADKGREEACGCDRGPTASVRSAGGLPQTACPRLGEGDQT